MYCAKCGKPVAADAFFCQWCGAELDQFDETWTAAKIKSLREKSPELDIAKYVARLWRSGEYKNKYGSWEEYANIELDMEKSLAFKYKDVGMRFFDEAGKPLLPNLKEWGFAKLLKIQSFSNDEIMYFQEKGILEPSMSLKQIDEIQKRLNEAKRMLHE